MPAGNPGKPLPMHVRTFQKPLMKNVSHSFYLFLLLCLTACGEKLDQIDDAALQPERLQELVPLQPGKYITYRLDSTVFTNLGLTREVHTYQEKNVVDALITDAAGQPTYRMFRYQRDAAGTQAWRSVGTYFITHTGRQVEWVENNRRQVKLALPVQEGTTWRGNQYLPSEPFSPEINNFSVGNALKTWDFIYKEQTSETIGTGPAKEVREVFQIDESTNVNAQDKAQVETSFASRSYSTEKYAKGLGLVYQKLLLWEYQPEINSNQTYKGRYKGFGVERTLIDHN